MKYLTTQEAAGRLNISRQAMHYRIRAGSIEAKRIGRNWYVPESEISPANCLKVPAKTRGRRKLPPEELKHQHSIYATDSEWPLIQDLVKNMRELLRSPGPSS